MNISAKYVTLQNDGETQIVGFADSEIEATTYVLLQRTVRPTKQDQILGQDRIHITVNDEACSAYGGVTKISLSRTEVIIQLAAKTAQEMGIASIIRIGLEIETPSMTELAAGLEDLIDGQCELDRLQ